MATQLSMVDVTLDTLKAAIMPKETVLLTGIYRGIVTKCKADKKMPMYVKVKIFGITDEIGSKDQPWARSSGTHPIPEAGTYVDIVFENGDVHFPVWSNPSKSKNGKLITRGQKQSNQKNQEIYNDQNGTVMSYDKKTGDFSLSFSSGTELTVDKKGVLKHVAGPGGIPLPTFRVITTNDFCPYTKTKHIGGSEYMEVSASPIPLG